MRSQDIVEKADMKHITPISNCWRLKHAKINQWTGLTPQKKQPPVDRSRQCRMNGISYSRFIDGCTKAGITINRKMLSEIATHDAGGIAKVVETEKAKVA